MTLEERIAELETTVAFQDDALKQMSDVMARQQHELAILQGALRILHERMKTLQPEVVRPLSEETPPPHY